MQSTASVEKLVTSAKHGKICTRITQMYSITYIYKPQVENKTWTTKYKKDMRKSEPVFDYTRIIRNLKECLEKR